MKTSHSASSSLKELLIEEDPRFGEVLQLETRSLEGSVQLMRLSNLRRKAHSKQLTSILRTKEVRVSLIGGFTLFPLKEMVEHLFWSAGFSANVETGEFDNYISEVMELESRLYQHHPDFIFIIPNASRCSYLGSLSDSNEKIMESINAEVEKLILLAQKAYERSRAPIILANFIPPAGFDLGEVRIKSLASDWSYRKRVNLELGLRAPSFIHICDLEFLSSRRGILKTQDFRAWFETKQPSSSDFLVDIAKEIVHLALSIQQPSKKVLVLDADNTLWKGIVAEDGIEGIELGDTSTVGQAFKFFQQYILSLKKRGILLALCSKNEEQTAREVFQKHPEMLLKESDFVSFKANWNPKPENIRQIAKELNLGLDSFVFIDDSPGEIEFVKQWTPEVTTHLLSSDPSNYVTELQDTRLFEMKSLTKEDGLRTEQYLAIQKSQPPSYSSMEEYLDSLEMEAEISAFTSSDVPRIAQLINKSNQFNLTTQRRSEAEVTELINNTKYVTLAIRLKDRFVDHGLISVLIGKIATDTLEIDTWLMSCRVLQRQVENLALNSLVLMSSQRGCSTLKGVYIPTAKNVIVENLYTKLGFELTNENYNKKEYQIKISKYVPTKIKIRQTKRKD